MGLEKMMLNEVPNCNDAMRVVNNVHLITMGIQQFAMAAIQPSCRKANLPETRDNDTITKKVCADGNKLCTGKNEGYISSSLGGRSISLGRQAVSE